MDFDFYWQGFKALGQETRLKIVCLLARRELCVCELEEIMQMSQPAISQHLRVLKHCRLVKERREGQWIYYSLIKENVTLLLEGKFLWEKELPEAMASEAAKLQWLQEHPISECRRKQH